MEKFESLEGLGHYKDWPYNALLHAVSAPGFDGGPAHKAFFEDLKERKGALEIKFEVNGFELPFSAAMAALAESYDRCVEAKARELLRERVGELQDRLGRIEEVMVEQFSEVK